jgi:hypothetical protein
METISHLHFAIRSRPSPVEEKRRKPGRIFLGPPTWQILFFLPPTLVFAGCQDSTSGTGHSTPGLELSRGCWNCLPQDNFPDTKTFAIIFAETGTEFPRLGVSSPFHLSQHKLYPIPQISRRTRQQHKLEPHPTKHPTKQVMNSPPLVLSQASIAPRHPSTTTRQPRKPQPTTPASSPSTRPGQNCPSARQRPPSPRCCAA